MRAIPRKSGVIVRGDSGFCRDALMSRIKGQPNMHLVLDPARNQRLEKGLEPVFREIAVRRVHIRLCSARPMRDDFASAHRKDNLTATDRNGQIPRTP